MLSSTNVTHNISHTLKLTRDSYKTSITIIKAHERSRNPPRVQGLGWGAVDKTAARKLRRIEVEGFYYFWVLPHLQDFACQQLGCRF